MIKGIFLAVTEIFADFFEKISKFYHTFERSFFSINNTTTSKSYLDLSEANSPSIQNPNAISLKQKVFSGFSANGLASKAKNDGGVVDALTENSNSVRECDGIFKRRVQKKYTNEEIPSKHQLGEFSLGRSMIEMLGVLAIIAVLSVGGIAGYSKAMEQWKINKMVQQYNEMLFGVVQNLDAFKPPYEWRSTDIIKALNIAPTNWIVYKTSNTNSMKDDFGNVVTWFPESSRTLRITFDLNGKTKIQKKMCTEIANNVFMPLRSILGVIYIEGGLYFFGDAYCSPNLKPYERCIKELSIKGINNICTNCVKNHCFMQLYFYH